MNSIEIVPSVSLSCSINQTKLEALEQHLKESLACGQVPSISMEELQSLAELTRLPGIQFYRTPEVLKKN